MNAVATTLTGGKHGSKWIGGLVTALTVVSQIDPAMVPPKAMPYIAGAGGILFLLRGFVNSRNIDAVEAPKPAS